MWHETAADLRTDDHETGAWARFRYNLPCAIDGIRAAVGAVAPTDQNARASPVLHAQRARMSSHCRAPPRRK